MTTMKFSSLGGFAAHLLTIEADLELTREVCVEKACRGQDGDWDLIFLIGRR
jgi:hypothetical protein